MFEGKSDAMKCSDITEDVKANMRFLKKTLILFACVFDSGASCSKLSRAGSILTASGTKMLEAFRVYAQQNEYLRIIKTQ